MSATSARHAPAASALEAPPGVFGEVVAVHVSAGSPALLAKQAVPVGHLVAGHGIEGDRHAGRDADRAVSLIEAEVLEAFASEGFAVPPGAMGENLVVCGVESVLAPGARLRLGRSAVIEITMRRKPCRGLNDVADGLLRVSVGRAGWFARVLESGDVTAGARVEPG